MLYCRIIFYIFLACLFALGQQMLSFNLITEPFRTNLKGLTDFSIDEMNFSGNKKILIFGGTLNDTKQNLIIESKPQVNSTKVYNISGAKPADRSDHCTLINEYKMYIYGGIGDNGQILSDLWEFNSIFYSWSYMATSNQALTKCNMVKNSTNVVIFGLSSAHEVAIIKYSLLTNQWSPVTYSYGNSVTLEGKMWQGSTRQTLLSIDQMPNLNLSAANMHFTSAIPSSDLHLLPFNSSHYLLLTDTKITFLNIVTLQILLVCNLKTITGTYGVQISDKWLFTISQSQTTIAMEYYNLFNFTIVRRQEFSSPEVNSTFKTILMEGDIYFVSEKTLNTWVIYEHCEWDSNFTNIKSCFYNKIHCSDGFRGQTCETPSCPNTLALFDSTNYEMILYECSNHGNCTEIGCVCDQYWTGEDCSTYTRQKCLGEAVDNWPVINCECFQETTGGNSCEVRFCYNDCSQHGTCLSNGQCSCQTGYYGPDCSITIIEFPSATLTI